MRQLDHLRGVGDVSAARRRLPRVPGTSGGQVCPQQDGRRSQARRNEPESPHQTNPSHGPSGWDPSLCLCGGVRVWRRAKTRRAGRQIPLRGTLVSEGGQGPQQCAGPGGPADGAAHPQGGASRQPAGSTPCSPGCRPPPASQGPALRAQGQQAHCGSTLSRVLLGGP